jgi:hypothetical protein
MILFKESEIPEEQIHKNETSDLDFQFYTVVNNLSAVKHLPKNFFVRFVDGLKNFFYRLKK